MNANPPSFVAALRVQARRLLVWLIGDERCEHGHRVWPTPSEVARRLAGRARAAVDDVADRLPRSAAAVQVELDRERALRDEATSRYVSLQLAAARVRSRHPLGSEEQSYLAPSPKCPTCGQERDDDGRGGCPDRLAIDGRL